MSPEKCAELLTSLRARLEPVISVDGDEAHDRTMFKFRVAVEALHRRLEHLADSTLSALSRRDSVAACMTARASMEVAAILAYLREIASAALASRVVARFPEYVSRILHGSKLPEDSRFPGNENAIHINKCIEAVDKATAGQFQRYYDEICEVTHANWMGTLDTFGTQGWTPDSYNFGLAVEDDAALYDQAASCLWVALLHADMYRLIFPELTASMRAWLEQSPSA